MEWFWLWPSSSLHIPSTLPGWPAKPTPPLQLCCRRVEVMAVVSSLMTSERHTTGSATTRLRSDIQRQVNDKKTNRVLGFFFGYLSFIMHFQDAKVMSWWDYGYQITAMANRTILVDNNTWNNTHISRVGQVNRVPFRVILLVVEMLRSSLNCHLLCRPWHPQRRGPMRLWGSWTSVMSWSSLED